MAPTPCAQAISSFEDVALGAAAALTVVVLLVLAAAVGFAGIFAAGLSAF